MTAGAGKPPRSWPFLAGLPVYKSENAPLYRHDLVPGPPDVPWVPRTRTVEVDYTLVQGIPGIPDHIMVHPLKWDTFEEALQMLRERLEEAN